MALLMSQIPLNAIVIISAVVFSMMPVASPASVLACLEESWLPKKIDCLSAAAIGEGNAQVCLRDENPAVRWSCVAKYAEHTGDSSSCDIIPAVELNGISRDLCRSHLAVVWLKPALCRELTTKALRDPCFLKLVEVGGDKSTCRKIDNPKLRSVCEDTEHKR